jgi:hypothetical protein
MKTITIYESSKFAKKDTFMSVLENFCIYEETYVSNKRFGKSTITFRNIFDILVRHKEPRWRNKSVVTLTHWVATQ